MEITVFSNGASSSRQTWSGVPYYLTDALERRNVKINRVDISVQNSFVLLLIRTYNKILRIVYKKRGYFPFHTLERKSIIMKAQAKKVKKYGEKFPGTDCNLVFDFSTYMPRSQAHNIMICDWTIDYAIRVLNDREPNPGEQKCIQRQRQAMRTADTIITLFPHVREIINKEADHVYYIGNGINSRHYDRFEIRNRYASNRILFIGKPSYKNGALKLIQAVEEYNQNHANALELHIVGMTGEFLNAKDKPFVKCYGYLNKDIKEEEQLYYQLLGSAKVFCNPSENWTGAQSLMEACYWRLPAIMTPNEELIRVYGEHPSFGVYCSSEPHQICQAIEGIITLDKEEYNQLCESAFACVEDSTWDVFADKMIMLISRKGEPS